MTKILTLKRGNPFNLTLESYLYEIDAVFMKTMTIVYLLFLNGVLVLAQNPERHDKVDSIEMGATMDVGTGRLSPGETVTKNTDTSIVRLHKFKTTRIYNALTFSITLDTSKLA